MLAAEDEEEREDDLALPETEEAVPASSHGDAGEARDGGTEVGSGGRTAEEAMWPRPGQMDEETAPELPGLMAGEIGDDGMENGSGGRTARKRGTVANRRGGTTGEIAWAWPEPAAGGLWKVGPVWTVRSVKTEAGAVQRAGAAGRTEQGEKVLQPSRDGGPVWSGWEQAARGGIAGLALESVRRSGPAQTGLEQAGLKGLYRKTVQGLRPAAPALPPEQTGKTARAQEPGSAASLAVDELDRAVRRDSRRYDGGMSIY